MKSLQFGGLVALAGITSLLTGVPARAADEVVIAALDAAPDGGLPAMVWQKIKLDATRPAGIKREPAYRGKATYGTISLGDAKENQVLVVLDQPSGNVWPRLYVDCNGNGDLTDDPAIKLAVLPTKSIERTGKLRGVADEKPLAVKTAERIGANVQVVAHYNVAGRGGNIPSTLTFAYSDGELTYNRQYSRVGKMTVGSKVYKIGLIDQGLDGKFSDFKHEEDEPAKVTLLIDRDGDGVFNPGKKEAFDAAIPFRLGGGVYEVASIDVRGMKVTLRRSSKKVKGTLTAADLRIGGETIDFESDLFGGKSVSFPEDYKGRVVLLDFWATWCPPCREEVPNIVKVYEKYHEAGFDILGISLDKPNQDKTLKAFMHEFNMTWNQVYDGGFWKAEVAKLYGINSIPMAYLVDGATGKILAIGDELRGEGLERAVEAALSKKKSGN